MRTGPSRPTVAIVGTGASGTLTAVHIARTARSRSTAVDLVLLDPADRWGRGAAFGTPYDEHLLNVPASGMTAFPEEPGHFVDWRVRQAPGAVPEPNAFAPRREYSRYLDEMLTRELAAAADHVTARHLRSTATGVARSGERWAVGTHDGRQVEVDAVVVATGLPEVGARWAPDALAGSAFFVADPWAPGALEVVRRDRRGPADVLVVGTGLTMVDVVLSLSGPGNRADRRLLAVSRNGRLPRRHLLEPGLAVIPDIDDWPHDLDGILERGRQHLLEVRATTGDWRPAVDGLRFRMAELWARLDEDARHRFLAGTAGAWGVLRHRMPPTSAVLIDALATTGRLQVAAGEVADAEPLPRGGLAVTLADGTRHEVGWVVNCTGPGHDIRRLSNPLLDDLLRDRPGGALGEVTTAGMGFRTTDGRLAGRDRRSAAPVWVLGALRRGELWETTAVPEIRIQARAVATSVLDAVAPLPRRLEDGSLVAGHHPVARPRDPLGLPLSTTAEAAHAFNEGLERVLRLQSGGEDLIRQATELDRDFAVAHAALAMLGHESGASCDVTTSLAAARDAIGRRGDSREASFVDVVGRRVEEPPAQGARALMAHISSYPRDVLAVSAAVPTIAFSGVTDVRQDAWQLVEGLGATYGDHWWYISLLAFTRQDQGRFEEAGLLAESALSCEPSSGHAVHAQTHVLYETGQHDLGRTWLDHWVAASGRAASHRAHFSWHAALHELALGDIEAVRRRYYSQLAPPTVTGVRSLVDSASLLWRWRLCVADWDPAATAAGAGPTFTGEGSVPPVGPILDSLDSSLLERPQTPLIALHAAVALAADGRAHGLAGLQAYCRASDDPRLQTVVAPVTEAFLLMEARDWDGAARLLTEVQPQLDTVGGSAAQREIVEEALLFCLVSSGDTTGTASILDSRIHRRPSPLDRRRRDALQHVAFTSDLA